MAHNPYTVCIRPGLFVRFFHDAPSGALSVRVLEDIEGVRQFVTPHLPIADRDAIDRSEQNLEVAHEGIVVETGYQSIRVLRDGKAIGENTYFSIQSTLNMVAPKPEGRTRPVFRGR